MTMSACSRAAATVSTLPIITVRRIVSPRRGISASLPVSALRTAPPRSASRGRRGRPTSPLIPVTSTATTGPSPRRSVVVRSVDYEQLAREILKEAGEVDAAEDALYGDARGDELPEHLRTHEGRRAALRAAKEKLARERAHRQDGKAEAHDVELVFDPEAIVARVQGREGWVREALPAAR